MFGHLRIGRTLAPNNRETRLVYKNGPLFFVEEMVAACFSDTSVSKKKTVQFHRLEDRNLSSNCRKNLNT